MYDEAMELTGWEYEKLRKCKYVAENFNFGIRIPKLSWTHHRTIAERARGKELEYLTLAAEQNLSVRQIIAPFALRRVEQPQQNEAKVSKSKQG